MPDVPSAAEAFALYGDVRLMPGCRIDNRACRDADVLIVRSTTRVDAGLLEASPVRFVGSATAGTDHLDPGRAHNDVRFASAPGSNAESVVEWVLAALLLLAVEHGQGLEGKTLGVIGCGHVGGRLLPRAAALGLRVLPCDPPLARAAELSGSAHCFVPYARVLQDADILTFHTPLTHTGSHRTRHLLDGSSMRLLKHGAWVLNASRGQIINEDALIEALDVGRIAAAALDVWNGEPIPDPRLVGRARIATPHVAGYGFDGKVAGSRQVESALREWLVEYGRIIPPAFDWAAAIPPAPSPLNAASGSAARGRPGSLCEAMWLHAIVQKAFDLRADDARFRSALFAAPLTGRADVFTSLRRTYPRRASWGRFAVSGVRGHIASVTDGLGMRLEAATAMDASSDGVREA
jgi:erythronate-4-phosphate dehydrogenase